MPILPQAHDGIHEALLMKKYLPKQSRLLCLRLWRSHYSIDDGTPIYLGYISEFELKRTYLMSYLTQIDHYPAPAITLAAPLAHWQTVLHTKDNANILLIGVHDNEK